MWRSPVSAALVARVRKQVGQGMPVMARSGQLNPGSCGCNPFSHNVPTSAVGNRKPVR